MTQPSEKAHEGTLLPLYNTVPQSLDHIHLMGICGTGMASLAGMLNSMGYRVTGSDEHVYPPMSTFLKGLCIPVWEGYDPSHLDPHPDLVIVGNVIRKENAEAQALARLRLPYLSFPQALRHFAFSNKRTVVISGTHGKTTTSALAAWIMETAGKDPGFMIGGIPLNFEKNFKLGRGAWFVIEGDEYDTAFFDKGPKFLHYDPRVLILTSIEFDHADIYRDLDHVIESFRRLVALVPENGLIIANGDDPIIRKEVKKAACRVELYGFEDHNTWRALQKEIDEPLTQLVILKEGRPHGEAVTPLYGRHNISNLLSTVALADFLHVPLEDLKEALRTFKGVKRRQEVVGKQKGVLILDDFAHHPSAVRETVKAVRQRYAGQLIAVFEPRSNSSRRKVFQERYAGSFEGSDRVIIPEPPLMETVPVGERFSSRRLVEDLKELGIEAAYFEGTDLLLTHLLETVKSGDIVLFMSNGGFDHLPRRLLAGLGGVIANCR